MAEGYISIHRKIFDNALWSKKPFSEGHAWIDLLLQANYIDKKIQFDCSIITVQRGSFVTSIHSLSERWGWSRKKVSNFLNMLSDDSMIVQKRTKRCTTVTIVKYDDYQNIGTTKEPQKNHSRTTEEPLKNITNKDNKVNKVNKKDIAPPNDENLPDGAVRLPDGSVSYANVKREWH